MVATVVCYAKGVILPQLRCGRGGEERPLHCLQYMEVILYIGVVEMNLGCICVR